MEIATVNLLDIAAIVISCVALFGVFIIAVGLIVIWISQRGLGGGFKLLAQQFTEVLTDFAKVKKLFNFAEDEMNRNSSHAPTLKDLKGKDSHGKKQPSINKIRS